MGELVPAICKSETCWRSVKRAKSGKWLKYNDFDPKPLLEMCQLRQADA